MLKLALAAAAGAALYFLWSPPSGQQSPEAELAPQNIPSPSVSARVLAGMGIETLPYEQAQDGCFGEVLSENKLGVLLSALPVQAREALDQTLSASEDLWRARLYTDEKGTGLCLPSRELIVRLPIPSIERLRDAVSPTGTLDGVLKGAQNAASQLFAPR